MFFRGIEDASLKGNKFLTNYAIILLCSLNEKNIHATQSLKEKAVVRTYPIYPLHPIIISLILFNTGLLEGERTVFAGCGGSGETGLSLPTPILPQLSSHGGCQTLTQDVLTHLSHSFSVSSYFKKKGIRGEIRGR